MHSRILIAAMTSACLVLAACETGATPGSAGGGASQGAPPPGNSVIDLNVSTTTGPNGEKPVSVSDLTLTDAEAAKLRSGKFSAAMLWHTSSAFIAAVQSGASDEFKRLGIRVGITSDANFDAGTQANQVQTAMAQKPSVILSLPVDPTSAASAYQPAVSGKTKLVFLSNVPKGFKQGVQYTSIVTDDLVEMGRQAADAMAKALGGKGEVGMLFYNASYYVTNQRDAAFVQTIKRSWPDIKITAMQGFTDPNAAEGIASAMLTQHPHLAGLYTSWATPAAGVLSALRSNSNTTTRVVTLDLDNPVVVDMVSGGQMSAVVADKAWELGRGMADAAAYALLGKQAPPFAVAGVLTVTKDNVAQGYRESLHTDVPPAVKKAMG
jgi:ribose transport system substrate-binding protein